MLAQKRVGRLTGDGEGPDLNAAIRAAVTHRVTETSSAVVGIHDAFHGVLTPPDETERLIRESQGRVMGRDCGRIVVHTGIPNGVGLVLPPENPFDTPRICDELGRRQAATRFVSIAPIELVASDGWGRMVALKGASIEGVTLEVAIPHAKRVAPDDEVTEAGRALGIELTDGRTSG